MPGLPRIFISHSHLDTEWCQAFVAALRGLGYDAWLDARHLQGGDNWFATIQRELGAREMVIVVLTPDAWQSEWVQREIDLAQTSHKRIIPLMHKQTTVTGFLADTQWLRAEGKTGAQAAQLVDDAVHRRQIDPVAPVLPAAPAPAPKPQVQPSSQQPAPKPAPKGAWHVASTHRAITAYYAALEQLRGQGVTNEQGLRPAFQTLLATIGQEVSWTLIPEARHGKSNIPDATLQDAYMLKRGFWEAKDSRDQLQAEVAHKLARGYPIDNTIFEDTRRAMLFQGGPQPVMEIDLAQRQELADLLTQFFTHKQPAYMDFDDAVVEFKGKIAGLAKDIMQKIANEHHQHNAQFNTAYATFREVCQNAIAPDITDAEIDEMLAQHLLTERIFRTVFSNRDFTRRNVIAKEIETVIDALTAHTISRDAYLATLERYYRAIEHAAANIADFASKQSFLNTVYESFFQGFAKDQADTHGIVYTPQPIVEFMCASVEHVLKTEFGRTLSHPDVKVLDPCTGTGSFIARLMEHIDPLMLPDKYRTDLFANEIMLLPYYIASMNIEHAYFARMEDYQAFEGMCFVDTLKMETSQIAWVTERNTERIARQNAAPLMVIIGNPPYNVGQQNENDNNKNRAYPDIEKRIRQTYAQDSSATNKNALSDAYVKFFRWATDRLRDRDGVVCFISNNSFVDQIAFDGMRKHLLHDFTQIWHLDLHGNVRKNPKISGTSHNVFGIQVGVGITIAIRNRQSEAHGLWYFRVPEMWRKEEKFAFLQEHQSAATIPWQELEPDQETGLWLTEGMRPEFAAFLPLASKTARHEREGQVIFRTFSTGVNTARDSVVYDFDRNLLMKRVPLFTDFYNGEVDRWHRRSDQAAKLDDFVVYDDTRIKWSRDLKADLLRKRYAEYNQSKIRESLYRPFCKQSLFFDRIFNEEVYQMPIYFPSGTENENQIMVIARYDRKAFSILMSDCIPNYNFYADPAYCFPFYTYDEDGSNRQENITDWALAQFQAAYGADVTKRDIWHYVYAMLHHPTYRERYAENLKRELPRIPLVGGRRQECLLPESNALFRSFVAAGKQLADLHLGYESVVPYPDLHPSSTKTPPSWRVTKMALSKDRTAIIYNDTIRLDGVPPECFAYRLGNRSALEWVIDQYQVTTDKRSGITSDPNRHDDPKYIFNLLGRVITVSLATQRIVGDLPDLGTEGAGNDMAHPVVTVWRAESSEK